MKSKWIKWLYVIGVPVLYIITLYWTCDTVEDVIDQLIELFLIFIFIHSIGKAKNRNEKK